MYLIEVIPIARGIGKETLSYFSQHPIPDGSIVAIYIRKKEASALVISSREAQNARAEIRSSDFALRKVGALLSTPFLSEGFIRAARKAADYSVTSLGGILNLLVPKVILESPTEEQRVADPPPPSGVFDRVCVQSDDSERFANYRSLIREEFARHGSVFFCTPTAEAAKHLTAELSKGIENYIYTLYGTLPKKKLRALWHKARSDTHPVAIVATGLFFSLCRPDLRTVVLENESSRAYKFVARPFLDVRTFAELYAKEINARFLVGDTLLRTETIYRFKQGEFAERAPLQFRLLSPASAHIVDMSGYKKSAGGKFESVSRELAETIRLSHGANEHLFIFSARRGLASQTLCGDCGTLVFCTRCHSPVALHRGALGEERAVSVRPAGGKGNVFFCHSCGERRNADERCRLCHSWKLVALGVGAELVEQEIRRKFPAVKIFRIDKDKTKTAQRAGSEAAAFYACPGSILLGTEMALAYLSRPVENTAVASLDSLFSLPDFRIHERILHLLLRIRTLTVSSFLIQTRVPKEKTIEYALKGNLIDFYREEIAARERFRYPPFTTLIKVSLAGNRAAVTREMEKLREVFKPHETEIFPAFIEEARGRFTVHALLRLPRAAWPEQSLLQKLRSLPPQFRVEVEPESLL